MFQDNAHTNGQDVHLLEHRDERWLDYIKSNRQSTAFHHPAWMTLISECYGYHPFIVAIFDDEGRISAGLPLMEVKSILTGKRWVSLPFTDYCQPLCHDPQTLYRLVDGLVALYERGGIPRVEIRWELPAHDAVRSQTAYMLHTVPLSSDLQRVLKGFKRTHRQNIGTAESRGVHIERGTELQHVRRFYDMQLETRRRKGIPVQPWKFFDELRRQILAQGLGFVLLAYRGEQCLAGGVFLHWQQTLTYKYAASSGEGQECRPNNLLSWTAMRWGCENGYRAFDLGRSELQNEGLRRFKRGWGADECPLVYATIPETMPEKGNGRLMSLVNTFIEKSPPWVCRLSGEVMYRHFG
jgi:CelD/BcsL family acetyltransferase involved in cellulose biosynthesis